VRRTTVPRAAAVALAVAGPALLGCATRLEVASVTLPAFAAAHCAAVREPDRAACERRQRERFDAPGGLVANERARYAVGVAVRPDLGIRVVTTDTLVGVDHARVLALGVWRPPFASARLVLRLDPQQTLERVGLRSEPGTVFVLESLGEAAEARSSVREAREEADR
jgi:hypothetical protein